MTFSKKRAHLGGWIIMKITPIQDLVPIIKPAASVMKAQTAGQLDNLQDRLIQNQKEIIHMERISQFNKAAYVYGPEGRIASPGYEISGKLIDIFT
jgi:hypothetical protein